MLNSFPFNIGDVAQLCDIPIKKNKGNEYVDCPFCGKKRKMNINYEKNQYRCPRCNNGGSMLKLYSQIKGIEGSNGEIVEKIKEELGIDSDTFVPQVTAKKTVTSEEEQLVVDFDKMKRWDTVYRAFLSKLGLGEIHRNKLKNDRYMGAEDVERFMFKSVPVFGYKYICKQLINEGYTLEGVGGFYYDVDGWNIAMNPKLTGYIIPVWNFFGFIEGLQVRLDKPFGKYKYHLISSDGYEKGTKTTTIPFFVKGNVENTTLVLSEGFFKAAIPNKIYGYSVLALNGVNSQKEFKRIIPYIKKAGYKTILEAFDADFVNNPNVAKAKDDIKNIIIDNGFNYRTHQWDISKGKGLDDFALNHLATFKKNQSHT